MRTLRTVAEMRAYTQRARSEGRTVGLVPTMGAFHAGHDALMRAAREACDEVVVSLFVNPAQFDDPGDLAAYPRDEAEDAARATDLGVDVLFAPEQREIYPQGHSTRVTVKELGEVLEGAERGPGHFAGVCTVVAKLLNIVDPDFAYFGAKDAQQVVVIRRMVRDLDMRVRIEVVPTVREPDGLALSSRNRHLDPGERERAQALHAALQAAQAAIAAGERDAQAIHAIASRAMSARGVEPEYLALVDPEDLSPVSTVNGRVLVAVAARVGTTRLIDNLLIHSSPGDP